MTGAEPELCGARTWDRDGQLVECNRVADPQPDGRRHRGRHRCETATYGSAPWANPKPAWRPAAEPTPDPLSALGIIAWLRSGAIEVVAEATAKHRLAGAVLLDEPPCVCGQRWDVNDPGWNKHMAEVAAGALAEALELRTPVAPEVTSDPGPAAGRCNVTLHSRPVPGAMRSRYSATCEAHPDWYPGWTEDLRTRTRRVLVHLRESEKRGETQ